MARDSHCHLLSGEAVSRLTEALDKFVETSAVSCDTTTLEELSADIKEQLVRTPQGVMIVVG